MQPTRTQPLSPVAAVPRPVAPVVPTIPPLPFGRVVSALFGKAVLLGFVGGGALGAVVGLSLLVIGAFFGVFIGAGMGLVQGIVNGMLIAIISRLFFYPLTRPILYRVTLLLVSVPIGYYGTFLMFQRVMESLGYAFSTMFDNGYGLVVAGTSACYAIFASQRVANHYMNLVGFAPTPRVRLQQPYNPYDHTFLKSLFNAMQPSYGIVSWICSFGFSERWRQQFIARLDLRPGMHVGDLMSGAGELWPHLLPRIGNTGSIAAVDFSSMMAAKAQKRGARHSTPISVLEEDSLCSSIPANSLDAVVCCYGVKTLAAREQMEFVREASRELRMHGLVGIVEISNPRNRLLRWPYFLYLRHIVPLVGRVFLADPLSYRMLAHYTEDFNNCRNLEQIFLAHGFEVHYFELFGGCASGIVGMKVQTP